jgi:transposase-like protein
VTDRATSGSDDKAPTKYELLINLKTAKALFRKAIRRQGSIPRTITLDGYAASHRAVREMKTADQLAADAELRSSKYLNNLIEQGHRG